MLGRSDKNKKRQCVTRLWWEGERETGGVRCVTETEKTALDHSANMSTEIKLVYYFQRGGEKNYETKRQSYFTLVIIIKFLQPFSLHNIKK